MANEDKAVPLARRNATDTDLKKPWPTPSGDGKPVTTKAVASKKPRAKKVATKKAGAATKAAARKATAAKVAKPAVGTREGLHKRRASLVAGR